MWLPTISYQFLKELHERLPNHRALFADFNHLDGALPGDNGPLVTKRIAQQSVDYSTYMVCVCICCSYLVSSLYHSNDDFHKR
jgi:hypothetical protein